MTVQIYSTKTPAERVADKLTGKEVLYLLNYQCPCRRAAHWTVKLRFSDHQSVCGWCGVFRLPTEVWEV
jgi:hypothetical protein